MSTLTAPHQNDNAAWKDTRVGKFTASTLGQLMTTPRVTKDIQARLDAGEVVFGDTALSLISAKAVERLTGTWIKTDEVPIMKRGLLLEAGGLHLLSQDWTPIEPCTWQPYGKNAGATPDGLMFKGTACMDLKCPGNAADVVMFNDQVVDGDFDSLLTWDKGYAWQIAMQALACGVTECWLVYFTDRLPVFPITPETREAVQTVIDAQAELYSQESRFPWEYHFGSNGYYFSAKRFTLTDELKSKIERTLAAAEVVCLETMERFRPLLIAPEKLAA